MPRLVILAASVFKISCGKADTHKPELLVLGLGLDIQVFGLGFGLGGLVLFNYRNSCQLGTVKTNDAVTRDGRLSGPAIWIRPVFH